MKPYIRKEEWFLGQEIIRFLSFGKMGNGDQLQTICNDIFLFPKYVTKKIKQLISEKKYDEASRLWDKHAFPGKPRNIIVSIGIWIRELF